MLHKKLIVYQKAFKLALIIHEISSQFPKEVKYSLIDQIRRSSRSVCVNIGEAYRKRRYEKHFISKLTDSDGENTETQIWLDFALEFKYISLELHTKMTKSSDEVGKILNHMMNNPENFR